MWLIFVKTFYLNIKYNENDSHSLFVLTEEVLKVRKSLNTFRIRNIRK